jgi:hypothetical protein
VVLNAPVEMPTNALDNEPEHVPGDCVLDLLFHIISDLAADEYHNRVIVEVNAQDFAEVIQEYICKDDSEDLAEDAEKDRSQDVEKDIEQDV